MNTTPNTHLKINADLCGEAVELEPGRAVVAMSATEAMAADERGLVHGGFIFGMADYAAMLAVNDPNVVLGAAESRFAAPASVGQELIATARVREEAGKKRVIEASVAVAGSEIFQATFTAFVLDRHVLDAGRD
jgi:acyl-coenzyme A thioesterase PaaI-like protein